MNLSDYQKTLGSWIPDTPDTRDFYFTAKKKKPKPLPSKIDMRASCPKVYDQGSLGSCTAQSIAAALHFTQLEEKRDDFIPGRLFIYYNTRVLHGTENYDSGASLRNTIKAVAKSGYCQEVLCPYQIKFFRKKPTVSAYADAKKRIMKSLYYGRVNQTAEDLKAALADNNPVIFGFSVYDSFMSQNVSKTGLVPMPKRSEKMQGGHAVTLVGYDDDDEWFIVRNSWGSRWGDDGYCFMPYDYILNDDLAADFWVIKAVP